MPITTVDDIERSVLAARDGQDHDSLEGFFWLASPSADGGCPYTAFFDVCWRPYTTWYDRRLCRVHAVVDLSTCRKRGTQIAAMLDESRRNIRRSLGEGSIFRGLSHALANLRYRVGGAWSAGHVVFSDESLPAPDAWGLPPDIDSDKPDPWETPVTA